MKHILLVLSFLVTTHSAKAVLTVTINWNAPAICTYPTASLNANISGGVPPYTVLWSNGATTEYVEGLVAGTYSITVTDDLGEQATASTTLDPYAPEATVSAFEGCPGGMLGPEFRMLGNGSIFNVGMLPITFQDAGYMGDVLTSGQPYEQALYLSDWNGWQGTPGTVLELPFTDAQGCAGMVHATIPEPFAYPVPQVLTVDGACSGGTNGRVLVHVPQAPNDWSHYIDLVLNGQFYDQLQFQSNFGSMFGQVPMTVERNDLPSGEYGMVAYSRYPYPWEWLEGNFFPLGSYCADTTWFTIPDLGYSCGTVSGTVYMDDNQNCIAAGNEARVPGQVLQIEPGGYFAMTNGAGRYQTNLPYGSYTVEQTDPVIAEHCVGAPQAFDLSNSILTATRNFGDTALIPRDVSIHGSTSAARPGFQTSIHVGVSNLTPGGTGSMTITLDFDPVLTYVSGNPVPSNVTGNTITWTLSQLTSFAHRDVHAQFDVPPDVNLIGTDLIHSANVSIAQPETELANNGITFTRTITGSFDPNAKEVKTSTDQSNTYYVIDEDEWLDYTIQFQNTGNDTAFFVVITDTLPSTLDPTTFEYGTATHSVIKEMTGQGILRFIFPNILLPDSNVNEPKSHGSVSFRIKPIQPLLSGTQIENIANIYFDFNDPVITEPSVLVAEFSTAVVERDERARAITPAPQSGNGPSPHHHRRNDAQHPYHRCGWEGGLARFNQHAEFIDRRFRLVGWPVCRPEHIERRYLTARSIHQTVRSCA